MCLPKKCIERHLFCLVWNEKKVKMEYLPWSNAEIMLHANVQTTALLNQFLMPPC